MIAAIQLATAIKMAIWIKRATQYHSLHLASQHTRYKVLSGPTPWQEITERWTSFSVRQTPGWSSLESSTMTSTSSSLIPCEPLIWSSLQIISWVQFGATTITYTTNNGQNVYTTVRWSSESNNHRIDLYLSLLQRIPNLSGLERFSVSCFLAEDATDLYRSFATNLVSNVGLDPYCSCCLVNFSAVENVSPGWNCLPQTPVGQESVYDKYTISFSSNLVAVCTRFHSDRWIIELCFLHGKPNIKWQLSMTNVFSAY